jgi:hypothetical protein
VEAEPSRQARKRTQREPSPATLFLAVLATDERLAKNAGAGIAERFGWKSSWDLADHRKARNGIVGAEDQSREDATTQMRRRDAIA